MPYLTVIQQEKIEKIPFEEPILLGDLLVANGYFVPHPCGGRGTCKKCTVLFNGSPVLACRQMLSENCEVLLPDRETISSVTGGNETGRLTTNLCLCLDIGTTTIALSLVSLDEKSIVRTVTAANPQRVFGADVISRIDHCRKQGVAELQEVLLQELKKMVASLFGEFSLTSVDMMFVAGNTTMLHLFFGIDCSSLGVAPYAPVFLDERTVTGESLGLPGIREIVSLPGISAFVGSDIVAGVKFVGLPPEKKWRILLDLGTNAEIALFSNEQLFCTAAAAGPCFEGANISCGMSASDGAICAVSADGTVSVIGGGEPKGLCATGLIDAIAGGVRREEIDESGFLENDPLPIAGNVLLTGEDIREFQLAKSAIRAATECLIQRAGITFDDIEGLYVAGGFSAGLNVKSASFVGLIPEELAGKFKGINNASLLGTVKTACGQSVSCPAAEYIDLSSDPQFSDLFMEYMFF